MLKKLSDALLFVYRNTLLTIKNEITKQSRVIFVLFIQSSIAIRVIENVGLQTEYNKLLAMSPQTPSAGFIKAPPSNQIHAGGDTMPLKVYEFIGICQRF